MFNTEKKLTVTFYMAGGSTVVTKNVKSVSMTTDSRDGSFTGYSIEWNKDCAPPLFTLCVPAIQAVVAE